MNLHEYQSKQLFARYGIDVPQGQTASNPEEALTAAKALGGDTWVVKAQVHAGGRGKAGGVKVTKDINEVPTIAKAMLGSRIVTHQTDAAGLPVSELLIETGQGIVQELYVSLVVDRATEKVVFMASAAGGMDIEEVAAQTPEKIFTMTVHPGAGFQAFQGRRLGYGMGLNKQQVNQFTDIARKLYQLTVENDASIVEINPLIVTDKGDLLSLDAKVNLDDNALYRHPDLLAWRDESQEDAAENAAAKHDLNYVTLDGDIGCMVNGAGLAMATMDIVKLFGGRPANFLDVGGGTTAARVAEAFKLILSDGDVKVILVNIFGGIVRCDLIAEGIITAVREVGIDLPVVVRLEGTNVEKGRELLAESGLAIISAADLADAAEKAVKAAA